MSKLTSYQKLKAENESLKKDIRAMIDGEFPEKIEAKLRHKMSRDMETVLFSGFVNQIK